MLKQENNDLNSTKMNSLNTAVLFLVFNRLNTTRQVFEAVRKVRPPRLYVAADGARALMEGEKEKVENVRSFILKNIDWQCDVKTLFRNENLGCKKAVSSAIDWFFEHESEGIILEDDCVPKSSFFRFSEELLEKYKNDLRVWHIAGNNFHKGWSRDQEFDYYFSYYGSIWGWATWRDRWQKYTVDMIDLEIIKDKNYLWDLFGNQQEADFRIRTFEKVLDGLDTWDFQWAFTRLINSGLSIVPRLNLVENIGFGEDATHTLHESQWKELTASNLDFPIRHPTFCIRDKVSDDIYFKRYIKENFLRRLVNHARRIISKMI